MIGLKTTSSLTEKPTGLDSTMTVENHIARKVGADVQARIDALKIGQRMQDLPEELWHESFRFYVKEDATRRGGPNLRLIRLDPLKPSLTVTGFIFNKFVHPFEDRYITVREAARLQGFPDELKFEGTLTSTQQQVGNAVPVQLAKAVFEQILRHAADNGLKEKKLIALSTFSGAGGMDIGADQASYSGLSVETRVATDFWSDSCRTLDGWYEGKCNVVRKSITEIDDFKKFWKTNSGLSKGPDLIYGGPPCQAFSQAGKQKHLDDGRGQLIFEFVRAVDELKPRYFVMENVSNMKGIANGKIFNDVMTKFRDCGYSVNVDILNSADYGSPQKRRRILFLGVRGKKRLIPMPKRTHSTDSTLFALPPYKTVGDAFANLPQASFNNRSR